MDSRISWENTAIEAFTCFGFRRTISVKSCEKPSRTINRRSPVSTQELNTRTGERVENARVVPELKEDNVFIMQFLRLGQSVVLTFYDRGANKHLVDGALAEREKLTAVSTSPSRIKIAGGKELTRQCWVPQGMETIYKCYARVLAPSPGSLRSAPWRS